MVVFRTFSRGTDFVCGRSETTAWWPRRRATKIPVFVTCPLVSAPRRASELGGTPELEIVSTLTFSFLLDGTTGRVQTCVDSLPLHHSTLPSRFRLLPTVCRLAPWGCPSDRPLTRYFFSHKWQDFTTEPTQFEAAEFSGGVRISFDRFVYELC